MSETKTYVFGNEGNNNSMLGIISALCQKQGLDPNMVMAMMNNRSGFGNEGGWFMWIIFLFFLMGWGGNGFGNRGFGGGEAALGNLINNDAGRELLMQAIQGNASAINQLSNLLNCSVGQIQQAINSVMNQVQQVGCQIGQSTQQIINSIQAGNCQIAKQIADCCCENRLSIERQTNTLLQSLNNLSTGQERGFSQISYDTARQTCEVRDAIRENTAQVLAGQRAAEMRELGRELNEKDRKIAEQATVINNAQQTAVFGQMIQQATMPLLSAMNNLQNDVNSVKCKLPETTNVPYSPVVGIPNCVAAQLGINALGFNGYNIWG